MGDLEAEQFMEASFMPSWYTGETRVPPNSYTPRIPMIPGKPNYEHCLRGAVGGKFGPAAEAEKELTRLLLVGGRRLVLLVVARRSWAWLGRGLLLRWHHILLLLHRHLLLHLLLGLHL